MLMTLGLVLALLSPPAKQSKEPVDSSGTQEALVAVVVMGVSSLLQSHSHGHSCKPIKQITIAKARIAIMCSTQN